jgi:hypothetical protein
MKNLVNKNFGLLKVIDYIETDVVPIAGGRLEYKAKWRCRCDCGAIVIRTSQFFRAKSSSFCCGDKGCKWNLKKQVTGNFSVF